MYSSGVHADIDRLFGWLLFTIICAHKTLQNTYSNSEYYENDLYNDFQFPSFCNTYWKHSLTQTVNKEEHTHKAEAEGNKWRKKDIEKNWPELHSSVFVFVAISVSQCSLASSNLYFATQLEFIGYALTREPLPLSLSQPAVLQLTMYFHSPHSISLDFYLLVILCTWV